MKDHVARTVSHCFHQLRLQKGCIKSLPFDAARAAVAAFVTSQVDRYNSLLVGAPKDLLDCLKSVLNAAAIGCCATGENAIMLHRSSVMFYTGSQFPFESSSHTLHMHVYISMSIINTFILHYTHRRRLWGGSPGTCSQ